MGRGEQRKVPKPPPQPKKPKQRRPVDGCDNRDKHSSLFDTEVFSIAVQPHEKLIASDEQRRLEEPIQTERPKKRKSGRRRNSNNGKNPRGRNRTESRSRDDSGFATPVSFSISVGVQTEETCFTKEQCSNLSSDYIIISDHIYDVGEFNHPGGREALSDFDGKNATSVFENSHQINHHILDTLSSLWVGQITPEISIAKKKKKRIKLKMSKQPPEPTVKKEKVWELEYDPESHGIPIFVMTVGIPGSGKSTWASHQTGYEIISSDDIRKELTGSLGLTTKEELIWNTVWNRISAALLFGKSVILDSTNTISNHRSRLLASLPPCVSYSKVFLSTPELSKRRIDEDIARGRCRSEVPYPAILKMYKQLNRDLHLLQSDGFPPLCDDEDEEECQYYTNK